MVTALRVSLVLHDSPRPMRGFFVAVYNIWTRNNETRVNDKKIPLTVKYDDGGGNVHIVEWRDGRLVGL